MVKMKQEKIKKLNKTFFKINDYTLIERSSLQMKYKKTDTDIAEILQNQI